MWPYYGTKKKLAKLYQSPKFDKIIEPFAGAAQYSLFNDNWQKEVILYDKYKVVADLWHWLINEASKEDILGLPDLNYGDNAKNFKLSTNEAALIGFCINNGSAVPKKSVGKFANWNKAKYNIADNLYKIKHWKIYNLDYSLIDNQNATWFIDPPYRFGGQWYHSTVCNKHIDYEQLSMWCKQRSGQVIVCENSQADWLPFSYLADLKGQLHKTKEVVWYSS
jgi:hypothetical protein